MVPPDTSGIPQGAPIVRVKFPETLSTNVRVGKTAFAAKCATCHGPDAGGRNGVGRRSSTRSTVPAITQTSPSS